MLCGIKVSNLSVLGIGMVGLTLGLVGSDIVSCFPLKMEMMPNEDD